MNAQPMVNFFDALKNCFGNYINFKGRIRRSEFWWFMLPINLISVLLFTLLGLYVDGVLGKRYESYYPSPYNPRPYSYIRYDNDSILALIIVTTTYVSCIALPVISATVRRLHDVGKNGNYIFIGFVPFFGGLSLLILLCLDSHKNSNKYGPSPKYGNDDLYKKKELNPLTNEIMATDNKVDSLLN